MKYQYLHKIFIQNQVSKQKTNNKQSTMQSNVYEQSRHLLVAHATFSVGKSRQLHVYTIYR